MILNYDTSRMKQLLESFYALTHIRIVIFDDQLRIIAAHPESDCSFCALLRTNPETRERCQASDVHACQQCRQTGKLYQYTCHAGLTEVVAPLRCGNMITGYIMFGQVLVTPPTEAHWQTILDRLDDRDLDRDALKEIYFHKHTHTMDQLLASAQILEACAGYLYLQRLIFLQEDSLPQQIDAYLSENLQGDLSVQALCTHFGISRSKLYGIAREYYNMGIEQLTRKLRVNGAKKLLTQTTLPVSEVATRVGYGDYNYFIKVFKKETGATPVQYRRNGDATSG